MTRQEFEVLVKDVWDTFPQAFKDKMQNVDLVVEEQLDLDTAKKLGLTARGRLLGLYQGIPLTNRTIYYGMVMPDKITLFQQNIEQVCRERGFAVRDEVKHVIQHEISHHFGISDEHLKEMGVY